MGISMIKLSLYQILIQKNESFLCKQKPIIKTIKTKITQFTRRDQGHKQNKDQ